MKQIAVLLAMVLAAAALAACGDDNGTTTTETGDEAANGAATGGATGEEGAAGGGAAGGSTVELEAVPDGGLAYTTEEATAEAGEVTIDFTNPQALAHDVAVEGPGEEQLGKTEIITEGSDSTTIDLEPGEYAYYCTVPGHREAGMEGTLTVE